MEDYIEKIKQSGEFIKEYINAKPDVSVVLGTGLGSLADEIQDRKVVKYSDIPNFPVSTVEGHAGELIAGHLSGKYVLCMSGRFHYYEGYAMKEVTFPVRVFKYLGIDNLIVSNASGGMNPSFRPGDLMVIKDHINLMGYNPLIGKNYDELGPRFPDMSEAYSKKLIGIAKNAARTLEIDLKEGVYVAVSGPNFETPAELKMLRLIGADAVGMSTVPEVIAARHSGMNVLGISCITDMAIAEGLEPLDGERVIETANRSKTKFVNLVEKIIGLI
ncbi:MAG: purine-nucleoside phosphorylase [Clostridiales bacterium]|nr:purine-nucleoside phosphorylase [Clostridiales bacterium]